MTAARTEEKKRNRRWLASIYSAHNAAEQGATYPQHILNKMLLKSLSPTTHTKSHAQHRSSQPHVLLTPPLSLAPTSKQQQILLLPSIVFSLTGGGYAHAVSPAYGKAWAAASLPWLLFLLLVTLRLDGERGDARPGFGRMKWLGVYFPLWIFLLMLIAAHQALPYVWDIGVFRPPPPAGEEAGDGEEEKEKGRVGAFLSRVLGVLTGALGAARAAREERKGGKIAAADAAAADAAAVAEGGDDDGQDLEAGDVGSALASAASNSGGGDDEEGLQQ